MAATISIRRPKNAPKNAPGAKVADESDRKIYGVYTRSILDTKVTLAITEIGKNIKPNLENKITSKISGKCISDGYIKPDSIKVISYSSGSIASDVIEFQVIFECMACLPVEGMLMECTCKTVTKAGIHAQVIDDEGNIPVTVFVSRDHHHLDDRLQSIKEQTKLVVSVIGVRFELNDAGICVIARLTNHESKKEEKPRIKIHGGEDAEDVFELADSDD
jgi:DNA-directed RNA polymerase subunit E'/Rpb7